MNEFTTLLAAPGQMPGEITLNVVRRIERAGSRVVVHLDQGGQLLLDESVSYSALERLAAWIALDGTQLVRRSAIVRLGQPLNDGSVHVLLASGEVLYASASRLPELGQQWVANVEHNLDQHPLDVVRLVPWPEALPPMRPAPVSGDFRRLFGDKRCLGGQ